MQNTKTEFITNEQYYKYNDFILDDVQHKKYTIRNIFCDVKPQIFIINYAILGCTIAKE